MNQRAVVSASVVTLVLSATAGLAATAQETFDARVTGARRHMRAACQAVQQIARASADQRAALTHRAESEVAVAVADWTGIARDFAVAAPAGYAGDPGWAQRIEDVRLDLLSMQRAIAAGEYRTAFLACAHACTWLTVMHEANGVTLPVDVMASLRKNIGMIRGLLAAGEKDKARAQVRELLAIRDAVVLTPAPSTGYDVYLAQLEPLSRAVDAVAGAARRGDDLTAPVADLAVLVERVYETSL